MEPRTALIVALSAAVAGIAIVAIDLEFGLEAELEWMEDGTWTGGDGSRELDPRGFGCATTDLRLVVDNDWLLATNVDVFIAYWDDDTMQQVVVLNEDWSLDAGEERVHAFTIPATAFAEEDHSIKPSLHVDVRVGDHYLGTCVQEADA